MTDALADPARREAPTGIRCGKDRQPRLLETPVDLAELAQECLDPIRQYGTSTAMVASYTLQALGRIAPQIGRADDRAAVLRLAEQLEAEAHRQADDPAVQAGFARDLTALRVALNSAGAYPPPSCRDAVRT